MLIAPAAPAPTAMQKTATSARNGCRLPGASTTPATPVKTTSVMTRGFSSAMKSEMRVSICAAAAGAIPAASGRTYVVAGAVMSGSLHDRLDVELVERRRRGNMPLQRFRPFAPIVAGHFLARNQRIDRHANEEQRGAKGNIGTVGGNHVPP